LIGVANSVEAVLPGMIARRRGHIVGISSLASFRGLPALSAYCAAKAGVNALFDSLRVELKRHGVRTTTICPGWIRTPLTAPWEGKIGNMMEPDDAVEKILRAIEQQRAFVAFPPRLAWLLHLVKCLPVSVGDWLLQREIRKIESMMQST
jgi:short-subunit dehydrogenase